MPMNKAAAMGAIRSKKTPAKLKAGLIKYAKRMGYMK